MVIDRVSQFDSALQPPASQYVFKSVAFADYLWGNARLIDYDYVRQSLKKLQDIRLHVVTREEADAEGVTYDDDVIEEAVAPKKFSFVEIALPKRQWDEWTCIPIWDLPRSYRVRIVGLEHLQLQDTVLQERMQKLNLSEHSAKLFVTAEIFHGGRSISPPMQRTKLQPVGVNTFFQEWLDFGIATCNLPKAARMCVTLWMAANESASRKWKRRIPVAWVNVQLVQDDGSLRQGVQTFKMWPNEHANSIGTCVENLSSQRATHMYLEFEKYALPIAFPPCEMPNEYIEGHSAMDDDPPPTEAEAARLEYIIAQGMPQG